MAGDWGVRRAKAMGGLECGLAGRWGRDQLGMRLGGDWGPLLGVILLAEWHYLETFLVVTTGEGPAQLALSGRR